jgi:hypothetical protein
MKIRMLPWSGLSASVVMLAAGAAFSGGATTSENMLVDYVQATRHLSAYPAGHSSPTTYLHDPGAVHALANLSHFAPPDPCFPLANAWNLTVEFDQHYGVTSTFVFDVLLTVMSDLQCHATVTASGAVQRIVFITPIPTY